jgi:Flp pilus assembly protein TadG
MSYVFIGLGLMAFLSASMLAIDVGMLMTARNQAQNSADAGALGGAAALFYEDFDDRTATGPAVTSALDSARQNQVMSGQVSVEPADVEFPNDPAGQPNRVKVTVYRNAARGNPLSTMIARYFSTPTVGVAAVATAEVSPANAMTCVKPFTIPDKWVEGQDPEWNSLTSTYEAYEKKGTPLPNPDVYVAADAQSGYTGYNAVNDRGTPLMIRAGTGHNVSPSMYFSITIGGITGANEYEENICGCNSTMFHWGDLMMQEPGNMMGPTVSGAECLIAKDPTAYWDDAARCAKRPGSNACIGRSPRIFPIPLYDPVYYDTGKQNGRYADLKVANWIGFFLDRTQSNNIYGRITPIAGLRDGNAPEGPTAIFPKAIRLVQ